MAMNRSNKVNPYVSTNKTLRPPRRRAELADAPWHAGTDRKDVSVIWHFGWGESGRRIVQVTAQNGRPAYLLISTEESRILPLSGIDWHPRLEAEF